MNQDASVPVGDRPPRWQTLSSIDRRVVGVLAEKAKTTPDAYPLSLNAVCTGCNQKSNRHPLMQLDPADVEESLDRLREMGAVGIVEGYGRVPKYRHYLYEWLGVDKMGLAVMTELFLRGAQTVGELRGRAARMEPIADIAALRPVLATLHEKGLIVFLTPEGRGQVVTHALLPPREMEKLREEHSGGGFAPAGDGTGSHPQGPAENVSRPPLATRGSKESGALQALPREVEDLRGQIDRLRGEVEGLREQIRAVAEGLERLQAALGE